MLKFSVLICALNEEKNIRKIITDIFEQDLGNELILDKVLVISDGSTDKTNEIINNLQKQFSNLELLINKERIGKALSFNKGKKSINSDYLISLDADIEIGKNLFINLFESISDNVGLIGGNPIPYKGKTIAERASYFSYTIVKYIKESIKNGDNFYGAHGRCLALSKDIYTKIELPNSAGTDQFMYFFTIKNGKRFKYKSNAIVYYEIPKTIKDYLKQNTRFSGAIENMKKIFGSNFVEKETYIPINLKLKSLIYNFLKTPINGFFWIILFSYGKIYFFLYKSKINSTGKWEVSNTTK